MNVTYSKELTHAFVATPENLKDIVNLFEKHVGTVEIRADCQDDISRNFDSVEKLIAYRNPKSKALHRVYFYARSDDRLITARIRFLDSIWVGILIDLTGPEDVVSILKEETLDIFSGMCPGYNIMSLRDKSWIVGAVGAVIGAVSMMLILMLYNIKEIEITFIMFLQEIMPIQLILALFLMSICFLVFKKPYNYLFPNAVFRIGQGNSRFERQQKVRWGVIIGFGVSLAASLVVPILMTVF